MRYPIFFVELVYDFQVNQINDVRSFISGPCLDKYLPKTETLFLNFLQMKI